MIFKYDPLRTRDFIGNTLADYIRLYPGLRISTPDKPYCWSCGEPLELGNERNHVHDWTAWEKAHGK